MAHARILHLRVNCRTGFYTPKSRLQIDHSLLMRQLCGEPARVNTGTTTITWLPRSTARCRLTLTTICRAKNGIEVISLDGSTSAKQFSFATPTSQWTPDSRAFSYIKNEGGVSNIWRPPLSGEPPKRSTHFNNEVIRSFDLSRDGKQLVMSRAQHATGC